MNKTVHVVAQCIMPK